MQRRQAHNGPHGVFGGVLLISLELCNRVRELGLGGLTFFNQLVHRRLGRAKGHPAQTCRQGLRLGCGHLRCAGARPDKISQLLGGSSRVLVHWASFCQELAVHGHRAKTKLLGVARHVDGSGPVARVPLRCLGGLLLTGLHVLFLERQDRG